MSSDSYKAEYQTSITANRIVKDLVKQKLPKGQTFDPGCWKAFNNLSPQEQLYAAEQLRKSSLESAVNPSAYFLKMVNKAMYAMPKEGSNSTAPTSKSTRPPKVHPSPQKQGSHSNSNGAAHSGTNPSLWADPEPFKVKITREKKQRTGKEVLTTIVYGGLMSGSLDEDSLSYFEQLTERQQLQAANILKRRLTPTTRNPSALLTSIVADLQSSSNTSRPTPTAPPQKSPVMPATSNSSLNVQRFFLDNLSPECRRAYERLPPEAQYRMKQRCAEDKAVRNNSKAFLRAIYSITGQGRPQPANVEGMNGFGGEELIPAKWSDSSDGGQDDYDPPQTHSQAWPEDDSESLPKRSWWLETETPSKEAGDNEDDTPCTERQAWPQDAQEDQPRRSWSSESQAPIEEVGHKQGAPLHTGLQAWPQNAPESQRRRSWSSESQAPSQEGAQSTSVAADGSQYNPNAMHRDLQALPLPNGMCQPWEDLPPERGLEDASNQQEGHGTPDAAAPKAAGDPPTAEAIDTAAQELMGLLVS